MSRTYRFKKAQFMLKYNNITYIWVPISEFKYNEVRVKLDKSSDEYKKRVARFSSDKKWGAWLYRGPGWFHNLYSQRPYRRDVKQQIHRYIRDVDYEIQILKKPKRGYWW